MVTQFYPRTHLLGVPAEIRNAIYDELFRGHFDSKNLIFLLTCRQIYLEAGKPAFAATDFQVPMDAECLVDRANRLSETQKAAINRITLIRRGEGGIIRTLTELYGAAIYPSVVSYETSQQLHLRFLFSYLLPTEGYANTRVKLEPFIALIFEQFFLNTQLSHLAWTGLMRLDEDPEDTRVWTIRITREGKEQKRASSLETLNPSDIGDRISEMEVMITRDQGSEDKHLSVKHKLAGELLLHVYSEMM